MGLASYLKVMEVPISSQRDQGLLVASRLFFCHVVRSANSMADGPAKQAVDRVSP